VQASQEKAKLIAFPENFVHCPGYDGSLAVAEDVSGSIVEKFKGWAKEHNIYILMGSYLEKVKEVPDKVGNTSVFINPKGEVISMYSKKNSFIRCNIA